MRIKDGRILYPDEMPKTEAGEVDLNAVEKKFLTRLPQRVAMEMVLDSIFGDVQSLEKLLPEALKAEYVENESFREKIIRVLSVARLPPDALTEAHLLEFADRTTLIKLFDESVIPSDQINEVIEGISQAVPRKVAEVVNYSPLSNLPRAMEVAADLRDTIQLLTNKPVTPVSAP